MKNTICKKIYKDNLFLREFFRLCFDGVFNFYSYRIKILYRTNNRRWMCFKCDKVNPALEFQIYHTNQQTQYKDEYDGIPEYCYHICYTCLKKGKAYKHIVNSGYFGGEL